MSRFLKPAWLLTLANVKSFPQRLASSIITVLSIACVAAVILSVLTMTQGMQKTLERTGLDNTLLVMRAGAISELQSVMFPMEVKLLQNHPKVLKNDDGQAIASAEMFVNAEYKYLDDNHQQQSKSLAFRGISENTFYFRPNIKMEQGSYFQTGVRELIIGQAIARKMPQLQVGSMMTLGESQWKIVGIFSDNNSVFESELWGDLGVLQSDYQRGNSVQSLRLAMSPDTKLEELDAQLQADPRLNVRIVAEKQFFAEQGKNLTRLIRWIGFPVAFVMAIGAVIAALNSMYAVIAARSKEIATQKAMGFSPYAISSSVLVEALLLALAGGLMGILPLYVMFDEWTAVTQDTTNLSQLMFNFDISAALIGQTFIFCIVIGVLGGIIPAIKAIKLPVTQALRDS